nr:MAG TPA: hypothetical protein [Caudoviricetes sp.]
MVVIKKLSNIIPVDFGEFQLEYVANDKGVKELDEFRKDLSKNWKKIEKLSDEKIAEKAKELVEDGWTQLFGADVFEKVYKFADEDTTIAFNYLMQAALGIQKEYKERNSEETIKKYLEG